MAPEAGVKDTELIAILRGVEPARALDIGDAVYEAGIHTLEVPLNSPDPFASIEKLAAHRSDWTIGAGTVLNAEQVRRTQGAGGRLVVAPNCEADVIHAAVQRGMRVLPGFATATEAFGAIAAGAQDLKLFPAVTYGPRHLQALRAVLPADVGVIPVGESVPGTWHAGSRPEPPASAWVRNCSVRNTVSRTWDAAPGISCKPCATHGRASHRAPSDHKNNRNPS